jgi:hypothetical protein
MERWSFNKKLNYVDILRSSRMDILYVKNDMPVELGFEMDRKEWFGNDLDLLEYGNLDGKSIC